MSGRRRGRPRRQYRIRVRAERRPTPDYEKLARALLEHAAIEDKARRDRVGHGAPEEDKTPTPNQEGD